MHKSRLARVVAQHVADLAHGYVNAVVGIEKNLLAPQLLDNGLAPQELTRVAHQQAEQVHRDALHLHRATRAPQLIGGKVKLEFAKAQYVRWHDWNADILTCNRSWNAAKPAEFLSA
jgi:hypothetical protein